ncbi:uncharacterized protein G6M90_00g112570 [Metarhizium brunneum]|uniref:Uncharacterized protein n=1 Tax=Metarhizium brunneum TaxID=500148 RepID=A0A7D5V5W4_9HYPO
MAWPQAIQLAVLGLLHSVHARPAGFAPGLFPYIFEGQCYNISAGDEASSPTTIGFYTSGTRIKINDAEYDTPRVLGDYSCKFSELSVDGYATHIERSIALYITTEAGEGVRPSLPLRKAQPLVLQAGTGGDATFGCAGGQEAFRGSSADAWGQVRNKWLYVIDGELLNTEKDKCCRKGSNPFTNAGSGRGYKSGPVCDPQH